MCARLVLPFTILLLVGLVSSCAHRVGVRPHPVYEYIAGSGWSPAYDFPEGTVCQWVRGLEQKRAWCKFPDGRIKVFPDNCTPGTSIALCNPVMVIV